MNRRTAPTLHANQDTTRDCLSSWASSGAHVLRRAVRCVSGSRCNFFNASTVQRRQFLGHFFSVPLAPLAASSWNFSYCLTRSLYCSTTLLYFSTVAFRSVASCFISSFCFLMSSFCRLIFSLALSLASL